MFDEQKFNELVENAVSNAMAKYMSVLPIVVEKKYIHSIRGLADFLQCSIVTAQKIKNSGRIPYKQEGRKVIFEGGEVLAAMSVVNGRKARA